MDVGERGLKLCALVADAAADIDVHSLVGGPSGDLLAHGVHGQPRLVGIAAQDYEVVELLEVVRVRAELAVHVLGIVEAVLKGRVHVALGVSVARLLEEGQKRDVGRPGVVELVLHTCRAQVSGERLCHGVGGELAGAGLTGGARGGEVAQDAYGLSISFELLGSNHGLVSLTEEEGVDNQLLSCICGLDWALKLWQANKYVVLV